MVSQKENQPRSSGARPSDANDNGKDPVRVEAGKKAAETRKRHEQEAAEGRGTEASGAAGGDAQGKNPNRVEGGKKAAETRKSNASDDGQDSARDQDSHDQGKDPVRVEAGKKAAETRKANASTNEDGKDPVRVEAGKKAAAHRSHEDFVEMGKKGGEARREGATAEGQDDEYDGKDPVRVEAGKKAAETRKHHEQEAAEGRGDQSRQSKEGNTSDGRDQGTDGKDPVRVEAGKKAAETRKRHEQEAAQDGGNQSRRSQSPSGNDDQGKDPVRVEAGKKAAETRKANASTNEEGKDPVRVEAGKKAAAHRSHEDFVEMGKKGGEARREQSDADKPEQMEEGEEEYDGKDPVRVEAGKKAAAHFDHEHFVELGKMGADARWHGGKHQHDDESATEDPKAKNARVEETAGGASNDAE